MSIIAPATFGASSFGEIAEKKSESSSGDASIYSASSLGISGTFAPKNPKNLAAKYEAAASANLFSAYNVSARLSKSAAHFLKSGLADINSAADFASNGASAFSAACAGKIANPICSAATQKPQNIKTFLMRSIWQTYEHLLLYPSFF